MSLTLADLGWSDHFEGQVLPDDVGHDPVRISAVHRDRLDALTPSGVVSLGLPTGTLTRDVAVGDWCLAAGAVVQRVLDRRSVLTRRAAGTGIGRQLIAANLDRLAVVTSCNAEFNPARLERYLALAHSGGVAPAIVLTKADAADPAPFLAEATTLARGAPVLAVDARDEASVAALAVWCGPGLTLGLVGSSGVGKSTLATSLTGQEQDTGPIREADARGRHTTSARFLIRTGAGGWLIDTPGMRELRLAEATEGIAATFDDLEALAAECRFSDCAHGAEPGCAVREALAAGRIDPDRLANWRKLLAEDRANAETVPEARARLRAEVKAGKAAAPTRGRPRKR